MKNRPDFLSNMNFKKLISRGRPVCLPLFDPTKKHGWTTRTIYGGTTEQGRTHRSAPTSGAAM